MPEASTPITTKEIVKKLDTAERTTGQSGAVPLQPKHMLLDATDVEKKHPDKRLRWLNLRNPEKVTTRIHEGYTKLPEEEGGRSLGGDMALFAIPRKQYDERVQRQNRLSSERMVQHNRDLENIAENMAKILRDKHGLNISTEQLLARGE